MRFQMDEIHDFNKRQYNELVANYEKFIEELTAELSNLKREHDVLRGKLSCLVLENDKIQRKCQELVEKTEKPELNDLEDCFSKEIVDNLREQLDSSLKEKECTLKLWQNAVETIDSLEEQLQVFQAGAESFVPKKEYFKMKSQYEKRIKDLERELILSQEKLQLATKFSNTEMEIKSNEFGRVLESHEDVMKIVKNLESEILVLQDRLRKCNEVKTVTERKLCNKEKQIGDIKKQNEEYRKKVEEAVQVVEAALNEKDAALLREKQSKEEIERVSHTLDEIIVNTETKVKNEVIAVKEEYNTNFQRALNELKNYQNEIIEKNREIERKNKQCSRLENEISKLQKGNLFIDESSTSKLLLLEKNLESTFQKLLLSEKQNIQLSSQVECIKHDMDQMAGQYERHIKGKDIEKGTFESRVRQIQQLLEESNGNLTEMSEKVVSLTREIEELKNENAQKGLIIEKSKKSFNEKIKELNEAHSSILAKLQNKLDLQTELNNKWKTESTVITDTFETLTLNLKRELQKSRKESDELSRKLEKAENKIREYKIFLELISKDVNTITMMTNPNVSDIR